MPARVDQHAERVLLRIGAVSPLLGLLIIFVADVFHGGHRPADLQATLPVYAANPYWELVHIAQLLGYLLLLPGFAALQRSIGEGASAALARLGFVVAVVALAIYGANQGVDGVAIQFVAEQWVSAPAADKADALRLADAVRHVEIGLTGFTQLTLGIALLLYGLAIVLGRGYPRLLGWAATAIGALFVAVGVVTAHYGFADLRLTTTAGLLLALWFLLLAVNLWRRAEGSPGHTSSLRSH